MEGESAGMRDIEVVNG